MFFNYLSKDLLLNISDTYKNFYVCHQEIPVITLLPQQLFFLISNKAFEQSLSKSLQKSKAIFVFGCTVALRVSDLLSVKFGDVRQAGSVYYLPVKTMKTNTIVHIKLPAYAVAIMEQFRLTAKKRKAIFPPVPITRLNNHIKKIIEAAGWKSEMGKIRTRQGVGNELIYPISNRPFRFCDMVSSHTMRRTAITIMLMMGMKEHIVRQVSGHTISSQSFNRYVYFAQSFIDNEMDKAFNNLLLSGGDENINAMATMQMC
ncbi:MAG: tyrosine-type recombinase/integrase [Ferruginibacter sp.]